MPYKLKQKKTLNRNITKSVMAGKVDLMSLSDKWIPNTEEKRTGSSAKRKVWQSKELYYKMENKKPKKHFLVDLLKVDMS